MRQISQYLKDNVRIVLEHEREPNGVTLLVKLQIKNFESGQYETFTDDYVFIAEDEYSY